MPITSFPEIDIKTPPPIKVFYLDSGLAIFGVPSNPEGIVAAFPGSFAIDLAGVWYRKNAGIGNTGWVVNSANATFLNVLRTVNRNVTPVGNVLAGLDTLHSFTLDTPNRLTTDLDFVEGCYAGIFATNDNNKRLVIQFDGQTIFDSGLQDFDGAADRNGWILTTKIIRSSPTTINTFTQVLIGQMFADGAGAFVSTNGMMRGNISNGVVVSNMTNNPIVLAVLAEGVATNDIIQNSSIVSVSQQ